MCFFGALVIPKTLDPEPQNSNRETLSKPQQTLCLVLSREWGNGFWRLLLGIIWVVVKIMVPFWVPIILRHLLFRVPKKRP